MKYNSCITLVNKETTQSKDYPKLRQLSQGTYFKFVTGKGNPDLSRLLVVAPFNTDKYDYSIYCAEAPHKNWIMSKGQGDCQNAAVEVYDVELSYSKASDNSDF